MPPKRKNKNCNDGERKLKASKPAQSKYKKAEAGAASSFISLKVSAEVLKRFANTTTQDLSAAQRERNSRAYKKSQIISFKVAKPTNPDALDNLPSSDPHLAPIKPDHDPQQAPDMHTRGAWSTNRANPNREGAGDSDSEPVADGLPQTARASTRKRKQTPNHVRFDDVLRPQSVKRRRTKYREETLAAISDDGVLDETNSDAAGSDSSQRSDSHSDKENTPNTMERPKLNLKLSFAKPNNTATDDGFVKPATPAAASPVVQTPSIKLKVGSKDGSAKKRKRPEDDQGAAPVQTPSSAVPKIKLKTAVQPVAQSVITPGGVRLHTKGKIPKRPLGVGYDSELSDTERDPVILESFVLRMQPGKDCDYLKEHIAKGTMGHSKMQGGADVGILAYDDKGRRCCLRVRQNKYAAMLVDLPTVSEGMKSWDGKRFIKSTDICQMMMVLGPVSSNNAEAEVQVKTWPVPAGVDPKTYQYAHGLTAPMQWVRKRRFERTKRTRVDEIEAIDRRVGQLLRDDAAHDNSSWEALNYDPRQEEEQYSATDSEDDEDADGEAEDYFNQNGEMEEDQPDEPDEQELNEFDQIFAEDDDDMEDSAAPTESGQALNGAVDSSGFVTSNADSPDLTASLAPTAAPTPGGDVSTPAAPTPGTDGDNESEDEGDGDDGDDREAKNEKDEAMSQAQDNLAALEEKRAESMNQLKIVTSEILRKRLAQKVRGYDKDIAMNRRILGLPIEGED